MEKHIEDKFKLISTKWSRNRLIMAPMDTVASDKNGEVKDFHVQHYASRMYGGIGTIIIEATAIAENGKITDNDLGIWSDAHIDGFKRITKIASESNVVIGLQLNHAGARSVGNIRKIAPGIKTFKNSIDKHVELMTKEDFLEVENQFVDAARRAKEAGFDFVEIHAAHSYLLNQILHPAINEIDKSPEMSERAKIIITIAKRIKEEVKIPAGIRFSITDHEENGLRPMHFKTLIQKLDPYLEYYHISSSSLSPKNYMEDEIKKHGKIFRIPYGKEIKSMTDKNVIVVGNVENREDSLSIIKGGLDGVVIGREILLNPSLPLLAILDVKHLTKDDYPWTKAPWFSPLEYAKQKNGVK